MTAVDPSLQAQVDAQLLEQGAFAPLELLFNSGRLLYSDYESWRRQEIEFLDGALMGNSDKIKTELEQAVGYAKRMGLVEQPQEFLPWHDRPADGSLAGSIPGGGGSSASGTPADGGPAAGGAFPNPPSFSNQPAHADRPLRASLDAKLQRLIGSRYIRAQNVPQMDLFFDNPIVALTNGIVQSLATRSLPDAQRQLDQLYSQAPTHSDLAAFDQLLAALGHLGHPVDAAREELSFLLEVTPSARRLLAAQSRDLLAPLWLQLAVALEGTTFDAADPTLHRSFALAQAQDWAAVSDCVQRELNWQWHAPLCLRVVESAFYRRKRVAALAAWCHVCWRDPANASAAVSRLRQPELTTLWNRFQDAEMDLPESDFPAWLLMQELGLTLQLAEDLPPGTTASEESFKTVHRCLMSRRSRRGADEIHQRKLLQTSNPSLFALLKGPT